MTYFEVTGFYGSGRTPCTILCATDYYSTFYVVEGGTIVNNTYETLENGVNVEEISDFDCFTVNNPIESLQELEKSIDL